MAQQVKMDFTFTVDYHLIDDFTKEIVEELKDMGVLDPVSIVAMAPEAEWMEFGTGPAKKRSPGGPKQVLKELDEWAQKKLGISDPKERRELIHAVYAKHMKEGMLPVPFFRPAIFNTLEKVSAEYFLAGGTTESLAWEMVREMHRILQLNDVPYTHAIMDIRVYPGIYPENSQSEPIPEQVWNDPTLHRDGIRRADPSRSRT